ncbi:DnaA ATPase domain-containing protein [Singulisphaera sp. PoT]|uniref:DnaA/Hda family protein n=1 Tax=Singulisphaera sp. PoT TaxID=3411797 RepID=UPI003BF47144
MDSSSWPRVMVPPATPEPQPWDGFLTGPENELAHASVLALAKGDAAGISPLVVHGPSGVGKSRLLTGLVSEWLRRRPESAVAHLAAESFAAACAEAADQAGGWSDLRGRFRGLDLFVIEDLHALERAPLALAELVHTLDALDDAGACVVVSARVGPAQWEGWPRRLVNRLVGGLAVRIDPPGPASRRRYLLESARLRGLGLAAAAIDAMVEAADGYRTLDGWLAKAALTSKVERRPLDRQLVDPFVAETTRSSAVTLEQIARAIAAQFKVRVRDLRSDTRRQSVAEPRHLAMHLARGFTPLSFQAIGAYFGGRDPATVRHACKAAAARLAADPALAVAIETLTQGWRLSEPGDEASSPPPQ